MIAATGLKTTLPLAVSPQHFPCGPEADLGPFEIYRAACARAGTILAPPDLPFD